MTVDALVARARTATHGPGPTRYAYGKTQRIYSRICAVESALFLGIRLDRGSVAGRDPLATVHVTHTVHAAHPQSRTTRTPVPAK